MRRKTAWITLAIVASLAAAAAEPVTVVDAAGRGVAVPQPVERIASIYGMGTYYIYTLGAGERLVAAWYPGVKSASQAPASLWAIEPRLGELLHAGDPNIEDLAARNTDLVVADVSRHAALAPQLEALGIPALLFAPETPQGVVDTTLALGAVLGPSAAVRAATWVADFWRVCAAARAATAEVPEAERPRVLFLGSNPSQVASGAMYQTSLIEAAGGIAVAADLVGSWNTANLEQVLVWNPDVLVIAPYANFAAADLLSSPDWRPTRAVQTGRVAKMPRLFAPIDTPLPESLLGVVWLSALLYPERQAFDVTAEVEAFYATYYDYMPSAAEVGVFAIP